MLHCTYTCSSYAKNFNHDKNVLNRVLPTRDYDQHTIHTISDNCGSSVEPGRKLPAIPTHSRPGQRRNLYLTPTVRRISYYFRLMSKSYFKHFLTVLIRSQFFQVPCGEGLSSGVTVVRFTVTETDPWIFTNNIDLIITGALNAVATCPSAGQSYSTPDNPVLECPVNWQLKCGS